MADSGQRTEQPTQKRLEKARSEGQFAVSREFAGALQFLAFIMLLSSGMAAYCSGMVQLMRQLIVSAFRGEMGVAETARTAREMATLGLLPVGKMGAVLVVLAIAVQLAMTRGGIASSKLVPDFRRLNPITRIAELPKQNFPLLFQALVFLPVFGIALWAVVKDNLDAYLRLPLMSLEPGLALVGGSILDLLWKAGGLFLVLGAFDFWRQQRRHMAGLRMSKQEIREEAKEAEPNPQMKARIRRLQRDLLRRRMMSQVPTATAVVVNPTHFAVAIRYQMETMAAPVVVAKGKNYLALRIRKKAVEHQIPIIENPPLAQALYKSSEVGQEIPAHLYRAVAEILAYIHRLMGGRVAR
jgi:flagellar biosynthesis protein FlhB